MSAPVHLDSNLDLLTPQEAAKILKLSTHRTMERWRTDGTGPAFVRIGRRVAYRRCDLQRWVDLQVRHSTVESRKERRGGAA